MKALFKYVYNASPSEGEAEYQRRVNSPTAEKTILKIKTSKKQQEFYLYYLPTNEMMKQMAAIYKNRASLQRIVSELPGIARNQFEFETLINEIMSTNEMEGVSTSRSELIESSRNLIEGGKKTHRFTGLLRTYSKLLSAEEAISIDTPEDIRRIYDELVLPEIREEDRPDGNLFRQEVTYLKSRTACNCH